MNSSGFMVSQRNKKIHPIISCACAQLSIAKLEVSFAPHAFYGIGALLAAGVCLLAALEVLAIRTPAVLILTLWVGSYVDHF
jgi:hypothetical protein